MTEDEVRGYFEYLDDLRESGVTNMFGCAPYVANEFGISMTDSRVISIAWMKCFDPQKTMQERIQDSGMAL